MSPYMRFRR